MFPQELLRREAQRRISAAGQFGPVSSGFAAVAVIAKFDPAVFAASALRFAAEVPPHVATRWRAAFTRTVFLAGQPANLTTRFPPDHLSADGTIAWYGPTDSRTTTALRRLLRPLTGPLGVAMPYEADIGAGRPVVLDIDVSEVTAEQYLVHLNHVLAEATIAGLLDNSASLHLRHVDSITPAGGPFDYLRVAPHHQDSDQLRCYAALSGSDRSLTGLSQVDVSVDVTAVSPDQTTTT